jgi:glycosyltransferase involved in cell wall biosynthesis
MSTGVLHVVAPEGIDDPTRPSGGNVYDRRLCDTLAALGWQLHLRQAPGSWPEPARPDLDLLGAQLDDVPDGSAVLVDGLVGSAAADVLLRRAARLRLFVLVHLPLGVGSLSSRRSEATLLCRVAGVVTTSAWTRRWLVEHYDLVESRVHVAVPGADPAPLATGTPEGDSLLCVGAVTPTKGQDLLLEALRGLDDLPWRCVCVGSLDVDPDFARRVRSLADGPTLRGRVALTGARTGPALDATYAVADVLVLPSRTETYGMVVTEALARGLAVVATRTGGTPESLGRTADGSLPGLLVPPGDPDALAAALRAWLEQPVVRERARTAARDRRTTLPTWTDTAERVAAVVAGG